MPLKGRQETTEFDKAPEGRVKIRVKTVHDVTTEENRFKPGTMREVQVIDYQILDYVEGGPDDDDPKDWRMEELRQWYTNTLGTPSMPSNLRPFVETWLGYKMPTTESEPEELDLAEFEGQTFMASITHRPKKDGSGFSVVLEAPAPVKSKRRPAPVVVEEDEGEEPLPPALQRRRSAPADDDFEIPEGFDTDAA